MTLTEFLSHWSITENPFLGEEARADAVFVRMTGPGGLRGTGVAPVSAPPETLVYRPPAHPLGLFHSDFEKIVGDLSRPATSIVFGEKGSGKTAIRLQMTSRIAAHNAQHPISRVLLVPYDDLNASLGCFQERAAGKGVLESLQQMKVIDHLDSILLRAVPRVVDALLGRHAGDDSVDLGTDPRRAARRLDPFDKRDLLLLQAVYDRSDQADLRTRELRRRLGVWPPAGRVVGTAVLWGMPLVLIALAVWVLVSPPALLQGDRRWYLLIGLFAAYSLFGIKFGAWDRFRLSQLARRVRRAVRVSGRSAASYADSIRLLPSAVADSLPVDESDEPRYAMVARLRRVLSRFGYSGIFIVVDRVDEPTLVSGDPDRMRAIVWPMLNNKFLQQEGLGVKLLLPVELRHALFKESSAFFQDARLDKQNFVERLGWTGPMLYDLCDARLQACRAESAPPVSLLDLFEQSVTRQDLIDALDQMHQPRDAFKFLYRCLAEHASTVTRDQQAWKIPRHVLDSVRKAEVERVQQLYRGIRPA